MRTKAIILCAGFGTRLGPLTQTCPKPMLRVQGIPILEYHLLSLKKAGIREIGINVHYLADQIRDFVGNGSRWNLSIKTIYESEPSGTAGGVKIFHDFLTEADSFFVLYGDVLTTMNLGTIQSFHAAHPGIATLTFHERVKSNSELQIDEFGLVTSFQERPSTPSHAEGLKKVNSGIYFFDASILKEIEANTYTDFPADIFPSLVARKELYATQHFGERYADACQKFPGLSTCP